VEHPLEAGEDGFIDIGLHVVVCQCLFYGCGTGTGRLGRR
jgi:hypothetical protein